MANPLIWGAIEYITRGAELNASSKYGRDPLLVDFDCIAGEINHTHIP
jgi:hypothetical protein